MTTAAKRICILTGNHLCHNPRVMKEAAALSSAGYDVTVLGGFIFEDLKRRDLALIGQSNFRYIPVVDWTQSGVPRLISRAGKLVHRISGIENYWQLGGCYPFLKTAAFRAQADLYICHMEQALAVGKTLHRAGKTVAVDMEDWHSEDLSLAMRRAWPCRLLSQLEKYILCNSVLSVCTSQAMAESLAAAYGCRCPDVVYNTFPWADREAMDHRKRDRAVISRPSVYWFSQTIGPGRGLEDLMAALPSVTEDMEIHLRGKPSQGYRDWLEANTPENWKGRIFLHDPVHNDEILSRIAEHDIGFAGEQPETRSRNLTISNKLFHYFLGGLAVMASDTAGQHEVAAEAEGVVTLYRAGNPLSLAERLNTLLRAPDALREAKVRSLEIARSKFCWELEQPKLIRYVRDVLG